MRPKNLRKRLAVATTLFLAAPLWTAAQATASTIAVPQGAANDLSPLVATPEDHISLQGMLATAHALPAPDARAVAKAFISERLGLDGDAHVVAHFATAADRALGAPDHTVSLTDALLEAFPEHARHTFFAELSDGVGGISAGGAESATIPSLAEALGHSKNATAFFRTVGQFLWSRTGPGYLYNTLFARGSVIATVSEDQRALDEAFGIYRAGGFDDAHASTLSLSSIVEQFAAPGAFAELPFVTKLDGELERYWVERGSDWSLLARFQFVRQARGARDDCSSARCTLTPAQYRQIMTAAAPNVPLDGPVTLAQLRQASPAGATVRRFDINGYPASDIVRFVLDDKSEVIYIPGRQPSFVVFPSEDELREWVFEQARHPKTFDALLAHFSLYNTQDSVLWTGVRHGLEKIGKGEWAADGGSIDHKDTAITGDVFDDMRAQTEMRLRDDARLQASTAWEAWRATINRAAVLLGPLGYVPALAIPIQTGTAVVQAGTGIEQAVNGRTEEDRKHGVEQAGMAVITTPISAPTFAGFAESGGRQGAGDLVGYETVEAPNGTHSTVSKPTGFVRLRGPDGTIGYPMGPTRAPRLPISRLYRRPDGSPARWLEAEALRHTRLRLPSGALPDPDGIIRTRHGTFVRWRNAPPGRGARVIVGADETRLDVEPIAAMTDRLAGPVIARQEDGSWDIAAIGQNDLQGSILDRLLELDTATDPRAAGDPDFADDPRITRDARTLHRAAEIMEELGLSEGELRDLGLRHVTQSPVAMLALAHAFVETLPARLRDASSTQWSELEVRILAPLLAKQIDRPLAFFRGRLFDYTAFPDGHIESASQRRTGFDTGTPRPAPLAPDHALDVTLVGGSYRTANQAGFVRSHDVISAVVWGKRTEFPAAPDVSPAEVRDLRNALADALETRSTLPELQRIHADWFRGDLHGAAAVWRISRLRHALFDDFERLSAAQVAELDRAASGKLGNAWQPGVSHDEAVKLVNASLVHVIASESALLPDTMNHLLVTDPQILADQDVREGDAWTFQQRRYVRLRDLYGRTQVVETTPADARSLRGIRIPGSDLATGRTNHELFPLGGTWYPMASPMGRKPAMSAIYGPPSDRAMPNPEEGPAQGT